MLHNAELVSSINLLFNLNTYPTDKINSAWKNVLLNQFHDVLPGSSIKEVYEDAHRIYDEVQESCSNINNKMMSAIVSNIKADKGDIIVFNPNGFEADGYVNVNNKCTYVGKVPSMGWKVVKPSNNIEIKLTDNVMENKFIKVTFNSDYEIISIFDKLNNKETVPNGKKANEFRMYEDLPYFCDPWDISSYYSDKGYETATFVSAKKFFDGDRAGFEVIKKYRDSVINQKICIYNSSEQIDFETTCDWHEHNILFKVAFPVDINSESVDYDIGFGSIKRNHTENTSWDCARFEVCAHKWADISDGGYGVALMNDCKYGYNVTNDNELCLTLIKCSNASDDLSINDNGIHDFKYSVVAHKGNFADAGITKKSYVFNNALSAIEVSTGGTKIPNEFSLVSALQENIIVDTVKKAENTDDVIVRLYDAHNIKDNITLKCGFEFDKVYKCNMLEEEICEITDTNKEKGEINLQISNYEIVTLKFVR
jgi:alpha-mannosidase